MARDANPDQVPPAAASAAASTRPTRPPASRSMSPLTQIHHLHYPPQPLYTTQPLPIRTPNPLLPVSQQDPSHGVLYPVVSSGRGFMSRTIRSVPAADQTVTVANPGGYAPRPVVGFLPGIRSDGSSQLDYLVHPMHTVRAPNLHQLQHNPHLGSAVSAKGVSSKVATPSYYSDCNGYKEMRDRVNDETFVTVRDRKVRISEDASLYSLCRSWLRNGFHEGKQPQYVNRLQPLPKPLPIAVDNANLLQKKEDKEEENEPVEESMEHLMPQDLLKSHIKRAKRVRAQLREERQQRIERYKTRLALLLPSPSEQFRSDAAAGN